jgi:hypothetical protein
MSGPCAAMPPSVSIARVCMWVQAVLGLFGLLLLLILMASAPASWDGAIVVALAVPLATILLIGFLALRVHTRRSWIRLSGLVLELLLVLLGVVQLLGDVSVGSVLGLVLPAVVFAQLRRPPSAQWFDQ